MEARAVWIRGARHLEADAVLYPTSFNHYRRAMKQCSLGLSLLVGLGLVLTACGSSSGGASCPTGQVDCDGVCIDEIAPNLASIQQRIFARSCAASSCHDADLPEAQLNLSTVADSAQNLVDVNSVQIPSRLRVAPGDSGASYLVNKITGVDIANGTARMPLNADGFVLCEPEIDVIVQWIDDGADVP